MEEELAASVRRHPATSAPHLTLVGAVNEPLPFDDPFADDTRPAEQDHRGRLIAPIIRDEFIDVP